MSNLSIDISEVLGIAIKKALLYKDVNMSTTEFATFWNMLKEDPEFIAAYRHCVSCNNVD